MAWHHRSISSTIIRLKRRDPTLNWQRRIMETIDGGKSLSIRCLDTALCAGISALLISIAHLHPEFWFISLFALTPFLWRATRGSLVEVVCLGATLAVSYCLITAGSVTWAALGSFLLKLLSLIFLFVLYGILVNKISKHIGFNAIFIAVFWLPVEYVLNHHANLSGMFSFSGANSTLLARISSFFGVLMISFLVVFINSLLLVASEHLVRTLCLRTIFRLRYQGEEQCYLPGNDFIKNNHWNHSFSARAPPI